MGCRPRISSASNAGATGAPATTARPSSAPESAAKPKDHAVPPDARRHARMAIATLAPETGRVPPQSRMNSHRRPAPGRRSRSPWSRLLRWRRSRLLRSSRWPAPTAASRQWGEAGALPALWLRRSGRRRARSTGSRPTICPQPNCAGPPPTGRLRRRRTSSLASTRFCASANATSRRKAAGLSRSPIWSWPRLSHRSSIRFCCACPTTSTGSMAGSTVTSPPSR